MIPSSKRESQSTPNCFCSRPPLRKQHQLFAHPLTWAGLKNRHRYAGTNRIGQTERDFHRMQSQIDIHWQAARTIITLICLAIIRQLLPQMMHIHMAKWYAKYIISKYLFLCPLFPTVALVLSRPDRTNGNYRLFSELVSVGILKGIITNNNGSMVLLIRSVHLHLNSQLNINYNF